MRHYNADFVKYYEQMPEPILLRREILTIFKEAE